jgi:putative ABC transport system permease protein
MNNEFAQGFIALSPTDLLLAAVLLVIAGGLSWRLQLGVEKRLLVSALRSTVQLLLLGLILHSLFSTQSPWMITLVGSVMLAVAGYEVWSRQTRRLRGWWGYGTGALSMLLSSVTIALLSVSIILQPSPWYHPQYLIPLLGMLLGNTMTGIAVAMNTLGREAWSRRGEIEARLMLGYTAAESIEDIRRASLRAGLIPIINSMATAGVVSLPGMMTGQILAGGDPMEAAKYQLMIMFLIAAGTALGATSAVMIMAHRLFDERERLSLHRLTPAKNS